VSESKRHLSTAGIRDGARRSLGFLIASAAPLALLVAGCGPEVAGRAGDGEESSENPAVLGVAPDFSLIDQRGAEFRSTDLRGRIWVANFIFTRCTTMCPILTREMLDLQSRTASDPVGERVRLVSFSVDPEHDRPAVLAEYAAGHGADLDRWTFATGARAEIWELSKSGFKLPVGEAPPGAEDPLFHSDRFVLVDAEGRIRGYYGGMDSGGVDALLADLQALAGEGEGS
jgi:protein SCO1/2